MATAAAKTVFPHITTDPEVCHGRPCIAGALRRGRAIDGRRDGQRGRIPRAAFVVITSYEPDPNEWEPDFKARKKR